MDVPGENNNKWNALKLDEKTDVDKKPKSKSLDLKKELDETLS